MNKTSLNLTKVFLITTAFGLLGILANGFHHAKGIASYMEYLAMSLLLSGATFFFGGLLGFLFGIPYTRQSEDGGTERIGYKVNTNLEKISDWLTGIIVGLTLVNLNLLPLKFKELFVYLAPGFGGQPQDEVLVSAIVIYFLTVGFLTGYLTTRTQISTLFRIADSGMVFNQSGIHLLNTIYAIMESTNTLSNKEINELKKDITESAGLVRESIFSYVKNLRKLANRAKQKDKMTKLVPIFEAIADADTENVVHAYHGQLGYALKDQAEPNYQSAEQALSKAIDIRGNWESKGFTLYEFNRALCRIKLQEKDKDSFKTDDIASDLGIAGQSTELKKSMLQEKDFKEWIEKNNINLEEKIKESITHEISTEKSPRTR